MECFLDPQVFIDTLDKGLEWCRIAREKNAEAEDRELYDSVRLQVQCLDGMKMTFQSENKRTGLRSSITPQVSVDLYEEVFPYSRSASVTLAENDLKTIAAALKKVPFTLIQEHAATEKKKEDKLFK